jgi:hypothetical protein
MEKAAWSNISFVELLEKKAYVVEMQEQSI